jgi:long-subunit acyl-CoA synthetase (AMP-forming)
MFFPPTLPDLLRAHAVSGHNVQLHFLKADSAIGKSISYANLYDIAAVYTRHLLAAGLIPSDIILSGFDDYENQIYLFWACCLAGIPICLLPTLHPDPTQQANLFNHLQDLFHKPTFVTSVKIMKEVHDIVPNLKMLVPDELPVSIADTSNQVFPARKPLPNETVCFTLTSGSTGNSKVVLLQHSNFLFNLHGKIHFQRTMVDLRLLNWISSDHIVCINEVHLHALVLNARSV